jgi:hypothetical protein
MTKNAVDGLGPVDFLVVEFPAGTSHFSDEMAQELSVLVETELVRVLDVLILAKDAKGGVEVLELSDIESLDAFRQFETELAVILAEEDVEHLAASMEPGTVAGVIIWENTWAAPFVSAVRRAGGLLVASGRIPAQALAVALAG